MVANDGDVDAAIAAIKAGGSFTENIMEGFIRISFDKKSGEFMRHAYQNNPYGGKGVDREEAVSENSVRSDLERVGRSHWAHLIERKER